MTDPTTFRDWLDYFHGVLFDSLLDKFDGDESMAREVIWQRAAHAFESE